MNEIFQLNLRHMDALLVTGRSGSMSAAAREVSLSQPALAQAVAKMERVLGERLFDRQSARFGIQVSEREFRHVLGGGYQARRG